MSRHPPLPLFVDAYLADTALLSTEESGAYLHLLMAIWQGRGRPLPDDDRTLARIVRATPARWRKLRPTLAQFFQIEAGTWQQKRIKKEWDFVATQSQKQRSNANARWRANALKNTNTGDATAYATRHAKPMPAECQTDAPPPLKKDSPSLSDSQTIAARDKIALANRMIGHLDGCRAELWHDDTMARAKPHRLDLPTALGWIDAGADEALVIGVIEAVLDRQHSAGDLPADSLRYFDRPVREALAARGDHAGDHAGGQAEAETPRREYTPEEAERIRLDTWVRMSPGHGDRDDAWYSMRHPRPTPEQVAEARRRLGFDPPTVDPASGK